MPVGTVIEYGGERATKTHRSALEPFPWLAEYGTQYGDEWAARALDDGAEIVEED